MIETLKKAALTGIGIAYMTKEKIEEVGKKIAEEAKLSKEEGKKLITYLHKQAEEAKKGLEGQVDKLVQKALQRLDVPTKSDLKKLQKEIKELKKNMEKQKS
jgi:polyhydroxyalkanoate synthesis regulator phasin